MLIEKWTSGAPANPSSAKPASAAARMTGELPRYERSIDPAGAKCLCPDLVYAKIGEEHAQRGGVTWIHRNEDSRHTQ